MNKKLKFWNFKNASEKVGELSLYSQISSESWWGDEITPKTFKEDLDKLGDIDTLNIYINSPGGDVFAGQTIYSILKRHKATKNVYVDGIAASIASVVAMAGDKVIMPKNSTMMIHKPWSIALGNANDFRKMADDLDKIEVSIVEVYKTKASIEEKEIKDLMDKETWLTADEALKYGFATEVTEAKKVAASIDKDLFKNYKNVPQTLFKNNDEEREKALRLELELSDSFLISENI